MPIAQNATLIMNRVIHAPKLQSTVTKIERASKIMPTNKKIKPRLFKFKGIPPFTSFNKITCFVHVLPLIGLLE